MRKPNTETFFKLLSADRMRNALQSSVSAADEMAIVRAILFTGKTDCGLSPWAPKPEDSCEALFHGIDEPRKQMLHALMSVLMHTSNITARVLNAIQLTKEGVMILGTPEVSIDISNECRAAMAELLKAAQGAAGIELKSVKEQIIKFER